MTDKAREAFLAKANKAYSDMIDQSRREECLGRDAKLKDGSFGGKELEAHCKMREFFGMHTAFAEAAALAASEPSAERTYTWQSGDSRRVTAGLDDGEVRWQAETLHEMLDNRKVPRGESEDTFSLWGRVDAALKASDLRAKLEALRDEMAEHAGIKRPGSKVGIWAKRLTAILEGK